MIRNVVLVVSASAGLGLLGAGVAAADPVVPDRFQPANGASAPGYPSGPFLTPAFSPVQVPAWQTSTTGNTTVVTAFPSLAPWVHNLVPIDPNSSVELRGAVRATLPDPATGGTLVVNPNGHCIFDGRDVVADHPTLTSTPLRPVQIDTPNFALTIEPTVSHR